MRIAGRQYVTGLDRNDQHLVAAAPDMYAKLNKIAMWLENNAALKEKFIKTCRFESINDEERANAKNYRATAADIRKLLAKADGVSTENGE